MKADNSTADISAEICVLATTGAPEPVANMLSQMSQSRAFGLVLLGLLGLIGIRQGARAT